MLQQYDPMCLCDYELSENICLSKFAADSVDYCLEPTNITVYKVILQAGLKIQYFHKAVPLSDLQHFQLGVSRYTSIDNNREFDW